MGRKWTKQQKKKPNKQKPEQDLLQSSSDNKQELVSQGFKD